MTSMQVDDHRYVFHPWSAQDLVEPLQVVRGEGSFFWDAEGNRYLDFASQQVNLNLGHQHPRLIAAIQEQAAELCTIAPSIASNVRNRAARLIAERAPGTGNRVLFTTGGAEAVENAIRLARLHTGRTKILAAYRSYHGATAGAIALTGDPRRWPSEPSVPGIVHFWGPYLYRTMFHASSPDEECARALNHLEQVLEAEGTQLVAAVVLETVVGSNGVLVPPDGYLEGVRRICDAHGVLLIADEVMVGFGRCGQWFAVDRWKIAPDLMTFAKGVNSGYVPLGGVVVSGTVADTFARKAYPGGSTYAGHPLACAAAVASIEVMEGEGVVENARRLGSQVIGPALSRLRESHPVVGEVRGLGVFWAIELVKDRQRRTPLVPLDRGPIPGSPMAELGAACRARGLWPFIRSNRLHVMPPCTASDDEVLEGISLIDDALTVVDRHYDEHAASL